MAEVKKWENARINEKINSYKKMSAAAIPFIGVLGGFSQIFNFDFSKAK